MDKELEAIIEVEKLIKDLSWETKHRVLDYVKARVKFDDVLGLAQGLVGGPSAQDVRNMAQKAGRP